MYSNKLLHDIEAKGRTAFVLSIHPPRYVKFEVTPNFLCKLVAFSHL